MRPLFFLFLAACSACYSAQCDIDFDFGDAGFGVSPDITAGELLVDGMLNEPYFDVLHILIPTTAADIDSTYPPTLPVDSVIVIGDIVAEDGMLSGIVFKDTVTNEVFHAQEIGLEVAFNNNGDSPNDNTLYGGEQYCAAIQGTPSRPGVYRISIDMLAWATIFTPFNSPWTLENLLLQVQSEASPSLCQADFDFMGASFGISPDPAVGANFYPGVVGEPYSETIHFIFPESTGDIPGSQISFPLDSVVLDSVVFGDGSQSISLSDSAWGLAITPNNNGDSGNPNTFLGGSQYCATLEGVPQVEGYFEGTVYTTAWMTPAVIGPTPFSFPILTDTLIVYPASTVLGCTDDDACNFDPEATANNGECDYTSCLPSGCTTTYACNYDPLAEVDSDDCVFPELGYDCDGNCQSDINGNGICDVLEYVDYGPIVVELDTVFGPEATGGPYDELVGYRSYIAYFEADSPTDQLSSIFSDTLIYPEFGLLAIDAPCGCWNPITNPMVMDVTNNSLLWQFPATAMYEYDTFWTIGMLSGDSPGSLPYWLSSPSVDGAEICNTQVGNGLLYVFGGAPNATAGDDLRIPIARITTCGSFTISGALQIFRDGNPDNLDLQGFYRTVSFNSGCTDPEACNFDEEATYDDGNTCNYPASGFDCEGACLDQNTNSICDFDEEGCVDAVACNYDAFAAFDDGSCEYAQEYYGCDGVCLNDDDGDGVCDENEAFGCTDQQACNYDFYSTEEDGSCFWPEAGQDCEGNSICGSPSLSTLTVEVVENVMDDLDLYRVYVNLPVESWYVSAVAGDQTGSNLADTIRQRTILVAPEGVYNSQLNAFWSAQGLSSAIVGAFPELAYDTYATIGLDGPSNEASIPTAAAPSFAGDSVTTVEFSDFFFEAEMEQSFLNMSDGTWYILPTSFEQANGDEYDRCLVGQFTTRGTFTGQIIVQVLEIDENGSPVEGGGEYARFNFNGIGTFAGVSPLLGPGEGQWVYDELSGVSNYIIAWDQFRDIPVCGCDDPEASNFIPWVEVAIDTCEYSCLEDVDDDGICDDVDECVGSLDECGVCNGAGANLECGCEGVPDGACDCDGNQLDVLGVCGGSCNSDVNGNGVCDDNEASGCTYPLADNFNEGATLDDGTCIFPCEGQVNVNVFDWDGDYAVTVTDFLMMLSVYGDVDVDLDGVWDSGDDCVDTNACNYANDPSEPCAYIDVLGICGGGCAADEDADGVCDDVDDCVGVIDECGVCNGPGPTEVVIEDITIMYDSVYAEQIDTWFVFEVGADTTFSFTCAPSFSVCGDPVSYQGYDYATVLIGDQCWFAENLRSENYQNGDTIPSNLIEFDWQFTSNGAQSIYGEGPIDCDSIFITNGSPCDEQWSLANYGRLYNSYAVDDLRNVCPSGWHVSSDEDWLTMEVSVLGMSEQEAYQNSWRGTDQGNQLKTAGGWSGDSDGTNSIGFSAIPAGFRRYDGVTEILNAGVGTYFWTGEGGRRILNASQGGIYRDLAAPNFGFSVRCVQDVE